MTRITYLVSAICLINGSTVSPHIDAWHDDEWGAEPDTPTDRSRALIHTTTAPNFQPSYDPCHALCEEFLPSRQGNGFDLCDSTLQSRCTHHYRGFAVCSNLFWSRSDEESQLGLVYAIEYRGLSVAEIGLPLTCQEADDLVYNTFNASEFNRTSLAYPFYQIPTDDPCRLLCEDFSADFRGNGTDLCRESSVCVNAANELPLLCTNLYMTPAGLVYSTTVMGDLDTRLNCFDAERIVNEYNRVNRTKIVTSALFILVNLSPVQNLLERSTYSNSSFLGFLHQYRAANNGILPSNLNRHIHTHPLSFETVFGSLKTFMGPLNMTESNSHLIGSRTHATLACCTSQTSRVRPGVANFMVPPGNTSLPLTQLLLQTYLRPYVSRQYCVFCQNYTEQTEVHELIPPPNEVGTPIMGFNIHQMSGGIPRNISYPSELDLSVFSGSTNLTLRLFALVNASHDVFIRAAGQWYHTVNNTLVVATDQPGSDGFVSADIATVLYQ